VLTSQNFGSNVRGVAFHPTKNLVASCSYDKSIKLWNADTGAELWTVRGHTARVTSVCFSPDGAKIVSGSWDKTVLIWDAASGEQLRSLTGHTR
jgi:WD40 repeat protein